MMKTRYDNHYTTWENSYVLFLRFLHHLLNIYVLFLGGGRPDVGTPEHAFSFSQAFIT